MPGKSMHTDPAAFVNELVQHAKDEAKKNGGNDPAPGQEVQLDSTITVSKTNPYQYCFRIFEFWICFQLQ